MTRELPAGWYADPADSSRYRYWTGAQWTTDLRDKGEAHIAAAEAEADARPLPDFDAPAAGAKPEVARGRPRIPVLLAILAVVAVAATAGIVTFAPSDDGGHTLTGEVRVATASVRGWSHRADGFLGDGARCGSGDGRGVGAGTEIEATSARGDVLGRGELRPGRLDRTLTATTCVFRYEIVDVEDAAMYVVQVAGREAVRAPRAEVHAADWTLDLRIP